MRVTNAGALNDNDSTRSSATARASFPACLPPLFRQSRNATC